jgi:hypothetical protein
MHAVNNIFTVTATAVLLATTLFGCGVDAVPAPAHNLQRRDLTDMPSFANIHTPTWTRPARAVRRGASMGMDDSMGMSGGRMQLS